MIIPLTFATIGAVLMALPAGAFSPNWTTPKRILPFNGPPLHASVVDANGAVHVASEKGSQGIHYITNKSGSWVTCQLTSANDRYPSITISGDVVHFAFARQVDGQRGLYTAASNQPAAVPQGCGFAVTKRYSGGAGTSDIGVWSGVMHVAFRTSNKKLKYFRGDPTAIEWTFRENVDGNCCTSAPAISFTTTGSVRIAYGNGTKRARGLKFALRSNGMRKKSKATSGRVKHVDLVLDHSPEVFTPPNNHPRIAHVVKGRGVYVAWKSRPNAKGSWAHFYFGRKSGPTGLTYRSNQQRVLITGGGNMSMVISGGPIYMTQAISKSRKDFKAVFHGGSITFSRKGRGVYYSRLK